MASTPCKDCLDRKLGCHDRCMKYKDWCAEREEYKKIIYDNGAYKTILYDGQRRRYKGLGGRLSRYL